jgi:hypothetical protein
MLARQALHHLNHSASLYILKNESLTTTWRNYFPLLNDSYAVVCSQLSTAFIFSFPVS